MKEKTKIDSDLLETISHLAHFFFYLTGSMDLQIPSLWALYLFNRVIKQDILSCDSLTIFSCPICFFRLKYKSINTMRSSARLEVLQDIRPGEYAQQGQFERYSWNSVRVSSRGAFFKIDSTILIILCILYWCGTERLIGSLTPRFDCGIDINDQPLRHVPLFTNFILQPFLS